MLKKLLCFVDNVCTKGKNSVGRVFIYIGNRFIKCKGEFMATACPPNVNDKLERIVDVIRRKTFQTDYYAEVVTIAENLGLSVHEASFQDSNISGYIEVDEMNSRIYVNREHCEERKRFTIAHEIGHFVLEHLNSGCTKYRRVDYNNNDDSTEEKMANKFAATLLMPRDMIKSVWCRFKDIKIIAATFGVSEDAAKYRVTNLNLV